MKPPTIPDIERFCKNIVRDANGCWNYANYKTNPQGYLRIWYQGKTWQVHRIFAEITKPYQDLSLTIDHLCRNKICVNPDHLEYVTAGENTRRSNKVRFASSYCSHKKPGVYICTDCRKRYDKDRRMRLKQLTTADADFA